MTHSPELLILQTSDLQHRIITADQIAALGISEAVRRRLLRQGFLQRIRRGLFSVGPPPRDLRARVSAVALSLPGSAAYRQTAARLHRLPGSWAGHVEVVVQRGRAHQLDGVRVHETFHLPSHDITSIDGLACTTVERTLIDLVTVCSAERTRWLLDELRSKNRFDTSELTATFLQFARRGRLGTARMRLILDAFLRTEPIDGSFLEQAFARLCAEHDLRGMVRQFQPPWYDGVRGIVDNAHPASKTIIETDGRAWHETRQALRDDHVRDRTAARHGWEVLRFDYDEVTRRGAEVAAEIRAVIDFRLAA